MQMFYQTKMQGRNLSMVPILKALLKNVYGKIFDIECALQNPCHTCVAAAVRPIFPLLISFKVEVETLV